MPSRAKLVEPLTKLTKDNAKFEWKEEQQQALGAVKAKCCEFVVLVCPKTNEPFHLRADACDVQVGGMLTQDDKALAAHSTKLNEAQKKHPVAEKELLAIDKCCQVFSNMAKGTVVIAHTDHVSLTHSLAANHTSQRVASND